MADVAAQRLADVRARIAVAAQAAGRRPEDVVLVAVSKTFAADEIAPVIAAGQRIFGENRVQEALSKWPGLKAQTSGLELHLIGPLQTNKASAAVGLFDVIETLDRLKLARVLAEEMAKQNRHPRLYVQINTGAEPQKAGVLPEAAADFIARCRNEIDLNIEGLMCIPPVDEEPALHFALLGKLARANGLEKLSMGMSADFEKAIALGATYVRVGSAIFGVREMPPRIIRQS